MNTGGNANKKVWGSVVITFDSHGEVALLFVIEGKL